MPSTGAWEDTQLVPSTSASHTSPLSEAGMSSPEFKSRARLRAGWIPSRMRTPCATDARHELMVPPSPSPTRTCGPSHNLCEVTSNPSPNGAGPQFHSPRIRHPSRYPRGGPAAVSVSEHGRVRVAPPHPSPRQRTGERRSIRRNCPADRGNLLSHPRPGPGPRVSGSLLGYTKDQRPTGAPYPPLKAADPLQDAGIRQRVTSRRCGATTPYRATTDYTGTSVSGINRLNGGQSLGEPWQVAPSYSPPPPATTGQGTTRKPGTEVERSRTFIIPTCRSPVRTETGRGRDTSPSLSRYHAPPRPQTRLSTKCGTAGEDANTGLVIPVATRTPVPRLGGHRCGDSAPVAQPRYQSSNVPFFVRGTRWPRTRPPWWLVERRGTVLVCGDRTQRWGAPSTRSSWVRIPAGAFRSRSVEAIMLAFRIRCPVSPQTQEQRTAYPPALSATVSCTNGYGHRVGTADDMGSSPIGTIIVTSAMVQRKDDGLWIRRRRFESSWHYRRGPRTYVRSSVQPSSVAHALLLQRRGAPCKRHRRRVGPGVGRGPCCRSHRPLRRHTTHRTDGGCPDG